MTYPLSDAQSCDIARRFSYQAPKPDQIERYTQLREAVKDLAILITQLTPVSREQSTALTQLTVVNMLANAAIAINEA